MSTNSRLIEAPVEKVWDVLADGWLYPLFVVGASRMRDVEESWPAVDATLHHSVGVWPALIDDSTTVLECVPHERLKLRARGWPAGEAEVTFLLDAQDGATEVTIVEDAVSGPGLLVPKPLRDIQLAWRNVETLRRLAFVAERREG
ncbi:SRPBCC family protein [uncultured Nocardioides sp.]|uniref:SRPBCC family protein n=1 Tax=uncultured Nocardioides sp. TaxID=198441 RepID=UPI0025E3605A|nr:SRPBCC family protein [uncultured Nocardioides sp.]